MSKSSEFPTVPLEDVVEVLDHLRVPVNGAERLGRTGTVPYYGANGLQGWIDKPIFDEPLILLAEDGGNFEDFASRPIAYRIDGPSWVNNHAHIIRAKTGVCQSYIFWSLVNKDIRKFIAGGTRTKLTQGELRRIEISLPDAKEQQAIAQILDTLDTAIRETEALIDKLKAVKQGLLHDLLTRGIDANGQLRPPQSEAPQLYKESPLGWIPREWDIVRVGEDTDVEHGFAFSGHQFTDKEIGPALLVPGNFHREGGLYFTPENTKYFAGKYPQQYVLSHGDVLVVMTDLSPMTLILGRTVVLTETFKVLHNQRIGKFRFKKDGLWNPAFFAEALSQDAVRLKVIAEATGTTVRHTSPDRIKSCYVARPKLQEQKLSAQRISTANERLKLEEAKLLKQRQTKSGLMDDLLTGRVRVTPLLESVQPAAAQAGA